MSQRAAMDAALKRMVARDLRPQGFRGSLPHLRRIGDDRVDLLSVQYHSAGGSFVVEVASCPTTGITTSWGKHLPAQKATTQFISPPNRPRLGSPTFPGGDHWFSFGPRNHEPGADRVRPVAHYDNIAAQVSALVVRQAEPYWRTRPAAPSS